MAEGSAVADKPECAAAPASGLSRVESLFHRRIEFHRARKPYSSFSSSDGDFRLETLNPSLGLDRPVVSRGGAFPAGAPSPGKRSGEREFYEHGMDPELSFSITFRRIVSLLGSRAIWLKPRLRRNEAVASDHLLLQFVDDGLLFLILFCS